MAIRITYDSKTIDLLIGSDGLQSDYGVERSQNRAGSGKIESIVHHHIQELSFNAHFVESTYRDLLAWWSWALQGNEFAFNFDSAKAVNTTLIGAAAAGSSEISLASLSGLTAGYYLIRDTDGLTFEIVELGSTPTTITDRSDVTITDRSGAALTTSYGVALEDVLKFGYAEGSLFRHKDYYPAVFTLDTEFNPPKRGEYYEHTFRFVEVL